MIGESKYSNEVMKKHFNKELVMTREYDEDFKNSIKCWISDDDYIDTNVKIRDYCHITEHIEALQIETVISTLD